MLKIAMLALGASLTVGAIVPHEASAQLNGRARSQGATTPRAGGVIVGTNDGRYDRNGCYEDDRYDNRGEKDKHGKWKKKDHDEHDRKGRRDDDDRDDDRYDNGRTRANSNGNSNYDCNNGTSANSTGGPAFCRNGQGHPVYGMAWCRDKGWDNNSLRSTGWQDVVLRRPRNVGQRDLSRGNLEDILGRSVYSRFDQQRSRLGVRDQLIGRWLDTSNGSVLNLFAGGLQVAQIVDRNRDGRADLVLLNYGNAR